MNKIHIIRNVDRVLIGVPVGHHHLRVFIQLKNESSLVFQEATIANILRAYTTVKTHPTIRAQELKMEAFTTQPLKEGFATHQLLETSRKSEDIEGELRTLLEKGASTS